MIIYDYAMALPRVKVKNSLYTSLVAHQAGQNCTTGYPRFPDFSIG